jgi:hypothetical protein
MAARDTTPEKSFKEEAKSIVDEEFAGLSGEMDDSEPAEEETLETDEPLDDDDEIEDDETEEGDEGDDDGAEDDGEHDLDDLVQPPAEGVDRGDGRDATGKFATKAEQDAADAAAKSAAAAPAEQPSFQPFKIRADKEDVAIPEAQVTRANGYVMLAVPEKDFARFEARIGRGHVAEKVWQRLTARERELEAEKSAPPMKSNAEIESQMILDAIKQHIPDLLTPIEIENLELKIAKAQRDYKDEYGATRTKHFETATREHTPEQEEQAEIIQGLAAHLLTFRDEFPTELGDLTTEELQDVFMELVPVQKAVFWKQDGELFANNQVIAKTLLAVKARRATNAAGTGALPGNRDTAAAAGTSTASTKAQRAAERHNRGVNSAAAPSTTSLKANRGKSNARSRDERNTRRDDSSRGRERVTSPELDADEAWRRTQRKLMASPGLDFDDGSDD